MTKRIQKGFSLLRIFLIIVGIGFSSMVLLSIAMPGGSDYTPRARVSELILASSSAKTALSEGMQTYGTFSSKWMSNITISATGMVSSASISPKGVITVWGTAPTSGAVITMTPTVTTDNKLVWTCTGTPVKHMPASCR